MRRVATGLTLYHGLALSGAWRHQHHACLGTTLFLHTVCVNTNLATGAQVTKDAFTHIGSSFPDTKRWSALLAPVPSRDVRGGQGTARSNLAGCCQAAILFAARTALHQRDSIPQQTSMAKAETLRLKVSGDSLFLNRQEPTQMSGMPFLQQ